MTVTPELIEKIQRYYHVERWRTGTIARQLQVHHGTVERVLRQAGLPRIGVVRASRIDPYLPFIHETLKKFPTLGASRLYTMARERATRAGPITSVTSSPTIGRGPPPRPTFAWSRWWVSRARSTGPTLVICKSEGPNVP